MQVDNMKQEESQNKKLGYAQQSNATPENTTGLLSYQTMRNPLLLTKLNWI